MLSNDNIYKIGTIVQARVAPSLQLTILNYYQRIYYCAVVDHPEQKPLAYYERELVPPADGKFEIFPNESPY